MTNYKGREGNTHRFQKVDGREDDVYVVTNLADDLEIGQVRAGRIGGRGRAEPSWTAKTPDGEWGREHHRRRRDAVQDLENKRNR